MQNPKEIFVFGSNEAGRHGAGAAEYAYKHLGAQYGVGFGPAGSTFAIPTKDFNLHKLDIADVAMYVDYFIKQRYNFFGCKSSQATPNWCQSED